MHTVRSAIRSFFPEIHTCVFVEKSKKKQGKVVNTAISIQTM